MLRTLILIPSLIVFSVNVFAQWTHVPNSPTNYLRDVMESNGILYLASPDSGVYKSTDGGNSWHVISNGLISIQQKNTYQILDWSGTLYVATVAGIFKSTNGGADWVKKSNGITIGPGVNFEFTESIFEYNGNLFTGAWNGIYLSTDSAENWVVTNITGEGIEARNFVNHNGILYAAKEEVNPGAYKSTDNGFTWESLTVPFYNGITFLSEPTKLWAGTIDGVWLSIDNGTSWEERNNGLSPDPYSSSIVRVNGILITSLKFGGSGVFRTSNEGLNWEEWEEGLPFLNSIEKLILFDDKIIAATSNGLWQRDTSVVITYSYERSNSVPKSYHLYQNYPNPFNPSTTISYSIPKSSFIMIKVYDLLGNEIANLVNEEKSTGTYSIEFGSSDLSSGVYFYQLSSGDFVEAKKMILLR